MPPFIRLTSDPFSAVPLNVGNTSFVVPPLATSPALETARNLISGHVPAMEDDRLLAPDIEAVQTLVSADLFSALVSLPLVE